MPKKQIKLTEAGKVLVKRALIVSGVLAVGGVAVAVVERRIFLDILDFNGQCIDSILTRLELLENV